MYTTSAAYPGIMANQYAPAGAYPQQQQQGDRSHLLANLRRPSLPVAQYPPSTYAGQQQAMYEYQQSQIEMEIARMQLQNLELQKHLLLQAADAARKQVQQQAQVQNPAPYRRERQSTGPAVDAARQQQMQRDWRSPSPQPEEEEGYARRDALQTLERAQRQRHASANGEGAGGFGGRGSRLSFGGAADGVNLIEHAKARHRISASLEPPMSPVSTHSPAMSTPPLHQSVTAFATPSPPRPTVVLSKPGEAYPITSPSPPPAVRVGGHKKTGSHSSSGSSAGESEGSASASFESAATSVGQQSLKDIAIKASLNPSAAAFTPSCVVAPPIMLPPSPPRPVVTPFRATRLPGAGGNGGTKPGSVVVRQPRPPCDDDELTAKNFATRIRRRAIGFVRRGRNSYIAPEEVAAEV